MKRKNPGGIELALGLAITASIGALAWMEWTRVPGKSKRHSKIPTTMQQVCEHLSKIGAEEPDDCMRFLMQQSKSLGSKDFEALKSCLMAATTMEEAAACLPRCIWDADTAMWSALLDADPDGVAKSTGDFGSHIDDTSGCGYKWEVYSKDGKYLAVLVARTPATMLKIHKYSTKTIHDEAYEELRKWAESSLADSNVTQWMDSRA